MHQRALAERYSEELRRLRNSKGETSAHGDDGATLASLRDQLTQSQQLANQYKSDADASKSDAETARQLAENYKAQADTAHQQADNLRSMSDALRRQLNGAPNNSKQVGILGRLRQLILETSVRSHW